MAIRYRNLRGYLSLILVIFLVVALTLFLHFTFKDRFDINIKESFSVMNLRKDTCFKIKRGTTAALKIKTDLNQGEFKVLVYSPDEKIAYQYDALKGNDSATLKLVKGDWRVVVTGNSSQRGSYSIEIQTK